MLLQLATWQEVDHYLAKSSGIILPIGSTEQHGPKGLLGTDALCPEIIAHGISHENIMIAPTINFGIAQHHLGFSGTISIKPSTLIAMLNDVIDSLMKHGFRDFYFLNGHGGNIATINAAFSEIFHDYSILQTRPKSLPKFKLRNWWEFPQIAALSHRLFGEAEGRHATPSEISLTYFAYPHAVKNVTVTPDIAPIGPIYDAFDYRERFPDGRIISNSNLASIESGKLLFEAATQDLVTDYIEFMQE
jgi:creatinine amidohydrolase